MPTKQLYYEMIMCVYWNDLKNTILIFLLDIGFAYYNGSNIC